MWKVDIGLLRDALTKVPAYELPKMNDGAQYIYNKIFMPLAREEEIYLSGLDFDAFDIDDITSFTKQYANDIQKHYYQTGYISHSLQQIPAASRAVSFV